MSLLGLVEERCLLIDDMMGVVSLSAIVEAKEDEGGYPTESCGLAREVNVNLYSRVGLTVVWRNADS
jgi:hypothetical protein